MDSVAGAPRAVLVPDSVSRSGWGRAGHRRAVLIGAVVAVVVLGGGVAAWAEVGGSDAGYRMATVTRTDIGTTLDVVGTVDPVADASTSFQVEGQVATVAVTPGQVVTAGQTLGTLDTTALAESVSSAQSTVAADEARLVEDEESESSSTTTTTTPVGRKDPDFHAVVDDHDDGAHAQRDGWPERHGHRRPEHADRRPVGSLERPEQGGGRPVPGPERLHQREHEHHVRPGHVRVGAADGFDGRAASFQGSDRGVEGRDRSGSGTRC